MKNALCVLGCIILYLGASTPLLASKIAPAHKASCPFDRQSKPARRDLSVSSAFKDKGDYRSASKTALTGLNALGEVWQGYSTNDDSVFALSEATEAARHGNWKRSADIRINLLRDRLHRWDARFFCK